MTETTNIFLAFELDNLNILINKNGTTPLFNNEKIFCKNSYKITNFTSQDVVGLDKINDNSRLYLSLNIIDSLNCKKIYKNNMLYNCYKAYGIYNSKIICNIDYCNIYQINYADKRKFLVKEESNDSIIYTFDSLFFVLNYTMDNFYLFGIKN
jgi:hypothetical protein